MSHLKKIVIKIGTSTLTQGTPHLVRKVMLSCVSQIASLHEKGWQVVLVTSGAIAAGKERLQLDPTLPTVGLKQMLAAVGQTGLMQVWSSLFALYDITVGQVLLTKGDFSRRGPYLNMRDAFDALLQHQVIPVINENDTVATDETKVGDNDNLSAYVANMIGADLLVLLTDQEGLFTADPRLNPTATLISEVAQIDDQIFKIAGGSGSTQGTGGMFTKIEAAKRATQSGTTTVIASFDKPQVLCDIIEGKSVGTKFLAKGNTKESRKRWLVAEPIQGYIAVDDGAVKKIIEHGASVLSAGILLVKGMFERGATVQVTNLLGESIAIGLCRYKAEDVAEIKGLHSSQIETTLGFSYGQEVIHRDDLVVLKEKGSR